MKKKILYELFQKKIIYLQTILIPLSKYQKAKNWFSLRLWDISIVEKVMHEKYRMENYQDQYQPYTWIKQKYQFSVNKNC